MDYTVALRQCLSGQLLPGPSFIGHGYGRTQHSPPFTEGFDRTFGELRNGEHEIEPGNGAREQRAPVHERRPAPRARIPFGIEIQDRIMDGPHGRRAQPNDVRTESLREVPDISLGSVQKRLELVGHYPPDDVIRTEGKDARLDAVARGSVGRPRHETRHLDPGTKPQLPEQSASILRDATTPVAMRVLVCEIEVNSHASCDTAPAAINSLPPRHPCRHRQIAIDSQPSRHDLQQ